MSQWESKMRTMAGGITDSHVHMGTIAESEQLLQILQVTGIERMALVAIQNAAAGSGLPQALYMKARYGARFYLFAGLNHATQLSGGRVSTPSLVDQVDEFVAMGCDGIKMIEGKPTSRQVMDIPVTAPYFADYWAHVEEVGLPIVWHVNDPEEFWDPATTPKWAQEHNWGYGPGDVQKEELYAEVEEVLARHPRLKVIFAHFYFLSADLERAGRFLDAHPSVCFDLAPGIEMLYNLSRDPDASHAFFTRYADRIVFGTDIASRLSLSEARARAGIVYRWLETQDTFREPDEADFLLGGPEGRTIRGMALDSEVLTRIYQSNFARMSGMAPRPLNASLSVEACNWIAATAAELSGILEAETEAARVALELA